MCLSYSNFSGGLGKTIFPHEYVSAIQGHWFWYQSKVRMRLPISPSFVLVTLVLISCTMSEILQVFALMTPCTPIRLFHPILGVFYQIVHVGVSPSINLKLISREIIFEVFQSVWKLKNIPRCQADRHVWQTDLTVASRGKNWTDHATTPCQKSISGFSHFSVIIGLGLGSHHHSIYLTVTVSYAQMLRGYWL